MSDSSSPPNSPSPPLTPNKGNGGGGDEERDDDATPDKAEIARKRSQSPTRDRSPPSSHAKQRKYLSLEDGNEHNDGNRMSAPPPQSIGAPKNSQIPEPITASNVGRREGVGNDASDYSQSGRGNYFRGRGKYKQRSGKGRQKGYRNYNKRGDDARQDRDKERDYRDNQSDRSYERHSSRSDRSGRERDRDKGGYGYDYKKHEFLRAEMIIMVVNGMSNGHM
jgi:hypothetical protein